MDMSGYVWIPCHIRMVQVPRWQGVGVRQPEGLWPCAQRRRELYAGPGRPASAAASYTQQASRSVALMRVTQLPLSRAIASTAS